jgi:N-acetylglucosamine-6-sulfatase
MSITGLAGRLTRAERHMTNPYQDTLRPSRERRNRDGRRRTQVAVLAAMVIAIGAAIVDGSLAAAAGTPAPTMSQPPAHAIGSLRGAHAKPRQGRPNILLFLTDDMRADDLPYMPNVQRLLVDRGVTFTHAFATNSLCCPARATLLTGQYSHNHRVMGNVPFEGGGWTAFRSHVDQHNLLPIWLQRAGYRTWHAGKHLNGFTSVRTQPGWDYWRATIANVYDYENWGASVQGRRVTYKHSYQELVLRRAMLRSIRQWAPSRRPFFMWLGSLAPHGVIGGNPVPEPEYESALAGDRFRFSPSIAEDDITDKPPWTALERNAMTVRRARRGTFARRRALLSVDDTVAAAVRALRAAGDYRKTTFIFTSDNGFLVGEHRHHGKNVPYEEAIAVPLVVAGPGFARGATVGAPVSQADITATVVDLANAVSGLKADGLSLAHLSRTHAIKRMRVLPIEGGTWEVPRERSRKTDRLHRFYWGARWSHYLYVVYAPGFREFYDLRADPYELDNAYRPPKQATAVQLALARWVRHHKNCVGRECNRLLTVHGPRASAGP